MAFADQNLRRRRGPIDQDQRGGIDGAAIGVMVGFFLVYVDFAHLAPATLFEFFVGDRQSLLSDLNQTSLLKDELAGITPPFILTPESSTRTGIH